MPASAFPTHHPANPHTRSPQIGVWRDHPVPRSWHSLLTTPPSLSCPQIGVWRDGAALTLPVRVSVPHHLVPPHSHDLKPRYYIFAGMVFTRLTNFYLRHHYGADWGRTAPIKLCERYFSGSMEAEGQEVVLLSKVGPHAVRGVKDDPAGGLYLSTPRLLSLIACRVLRCRALYPCGTGSSS